jgi:hypothetical protein
MEGFTGPYGAKDCAIYFQGNVGASSQVCIDNNRGTIWEGVNRVNGSWTQCGFNSVAISCEQSGYASWSRDYWLNNRSNQLHNIADWLAEESRITGIPLVDLTSSQAQSGGRGVCYHSDLGSTGCGHADPGANWPFDVVLEWARGGATTPAPKPPAKPVDALSLEGDDVLEFAVGDPVKAVSFTGARYKTIGIKCHLADMKNDPKSIILHCAFRRENGTFWEQDLFLDEDHTVAMVNISEAGGMSAVRRDDNTGVVIVPNFEPK